ncbi:DUF1292 domain-containing protein [Massiliimalia massiliensis]|jgi:uncharacterized protein YrzB (UPF0473 family)|uniref:DUF1292 domain-containing protein n=1 Tax=Massiliimalia massiliensis TaxID=1852384 RepID=UPI000984AA74|nr:DUF1292 domain-containing protein [Massiliimalia massiliensis]
MDEYVNPNETPTYLTLVDEEGTQTEFELLGSLEEDGVEYRALAPHYDDPAQALAADGQFVVLRVEEDENGEETLASIDNDEEYERIGELFLTLFDEEMDWE